MNKLLNLNRKSWAPWPYIYSNNWLISRQNQTLKEKLSSRILLTTIILQEAMFLISRNLGQINHIQLIQQQIATCLKCFGLKLEVKGGLKNLIFSIGFHMLKIWFFQMALNACEM